MSTWSSEKPFAYILCVDIAVGKEDTIDPCDCSIISSISCSANHNYQTQHWLSWRLQCLSFVSSVSIDVIDCFYAVEIFLFIFFMNYNGDHNHGDSLHLLE